MHSSVLITKTKYKNIAYFIGSHDERTMPSDGLIEFLSSEYYRRHSVVPLYHKQVITIIVTPSENIFKAERNTIYLFRKWYAHHTYHTHISHTYMFSHT